MARPRSIPIREELRKLFSTATLVQMAWYSGAVRRMRKVNVAALFWTVVLGFGVGRERTLAGLRRAYERTTGQKLEESSFYERFSEGFARMLRLAVAQALSAMVALPSALSGSLAAFRDLVLTDSTVVRLHQLLANTFPACRTNHTKAALKMHAVISVTGAGCQSVKITSERQHDGPVFKVGRWVRDKLLLFDLGYFRYQLFSCITRNGGYFISRLKGNANPRIVAVHRIHRGHSIPLVGMRLRDILDRMQCEILDVLVEISFPRRVYAGRVHRDTQRLRVVGIRNNTTGIYHFYITNVPVEILCAEDVGAVYAARWEVELLFKELKGQYRIEDLPSRKRPIVEALIYAAILTLIVSRRLLDLVRRKLRGLQHRFPEQRWAAVFVSAAHDLLTLMVRPPRQTKLIARLLCDFLLHEALDPHLDRPSLIRAIETRRHLCHLATA